MRNIGSRRNSRYGEGDLQNCSATVITVESQKSDQEDFVSTVTARLARTVQGAIGLPGRLPPGQGQAGNDRTPATLERLPSLERLPTDFWSAKEASPSAAASSSSRPGQSQNQIHSDAAEETRPPAESTPSSHPAGLQASPTRAEASLAHVAVAGGDVPALRALVQQGKFQEVSDELTRLGFTKLGVRMAIREQLQQAAPDAKPWPITPASDAA